MKDTTTQNEHNLGARIVMSVSTFPWLVIDLIELKFYVPLDTK